jgi:hypothetical protein
MAKSKKRCEDESHVTGFYAKTSLLCEPHCTVSASPGKHLIDISQNFSEAVFIDATSRDAAKVTRWGSGASTQWRLKEVKVPEPPNDYNPRTQQESESVALASTLPKSCPSQATLNVTIKFGFSVDKIDTQLLPMQLRPDVSL